MQLLGALDPVGHDADAAVAEEAEGHRGYAGQAQDEVAQVVPRRQADLPAPAELPGLADEDAGEVGPDVVRVGVLLLRDGLDRVHHVRDLDLLRAPNHAVVAGEAHPRRVAVKDLVPRAGADQREEPSGSVIHGAG